MIIAEVAIWAKHGKMGPGDQSRAPEQNIPRRTKRSGGLKARACKGLAAIAGRRKSSPADR